MAGRLRNEASSIISTLFCFAMKSMKGMKSVRTIRVPAFPDANRLRKVKPAPPKTVKQKESDDSVFIIMF